MFRNIETERQEKLTTLYSDCVEQEWKRFLLASSALALAAEDYSYLNAVYKTAIAQRYGDRAVDRYYVAHPIRVARFLARWCETHRGEITEPLPAVLAAALLHNVIEKQVMTPAYLTEHYGTSASAAIAGITPDRIAMEMEDGKRKYYAELAEAPSWVQALKILDKTDNLFVLCINPDAAIRAEYLNEIEMHLMPMVERVMPESTKYVKDLITYNRVLGFYRPPALPLE